MAVVDGVDDPWRRGGRPPGLGVRRARAATAARASSAASIAPRSTATGSAHASKAPAVQAGGEACGDGSTAHRAAVTKHGWVAGLHRARRPRRARPRARRRRLHAAARAPPQAVVRCARPSIGGLARCSSGGRRWQRRAPRPSDSEANASPAARSSDVDAWTPERGDGVEVRASTPAWNSGRRARAFVGRSPRGRPRGTGVVDMRGQPTRIRLAPACQ